MKSCIVGYMHMAHEATNRHSQRLEGLFENLHEIFVLKNNVLVSYERLGAQVIQVRKMDFALAHTIFDFNQYRGLFVWSHLTNASSQGYIPTKICIRKSVSLNNFIVMFSVATSMVLNINEVQRP